MKSLHRIVRCRGQVDLETKLDHFINTLGYTLISFVACPHEFEVFYVILKKRSEKKRSEKNG